MPFIFRRRVRTLYACEAENDSELSFEPNQIITNGKRFARGVLYCSAGAVVKKTKIKLVRYLLQSL